MSTTPLIVHHDPIRQHESTLLHAGNILGRTMQRIGLLRPCLRADPLIHEAMRNHRLRDFGPIPYREALRRLIDSFCLEARLSPFGAASARWDILRQLGNLLQLQQRFKQQPALANQHINAPIFITGLPRSGSTFLHRLLAQDPANRVPRHHQVIHPFNSDSARRARHELALLSVISPRLSAVHPMNAQTPQECTEIFSNNFASLRFDTTHRVPEYCQWLDARGSRDAYALHRRFLQYWQHGETTAVCWILKSPDHVFTLDDLLAVYPGARLVFTHRDPRAVLPSVANLTVLLRRLFSRAVDPREIGQQVLTRWRDGAERMMEADHRLRDSGRLLHLCYEDLVNHPMTAVERIYRTFERPLSDAARSRMQTFIERHRTGDYAYNHYPLDAFGFDDAALGERFSSYRGYFHLAPESI